MTATERPYREGPVKRLLKPVVILAITAPISAFIAVMSISAAVMYAFAAAYVVCFVLSIVLALLGLKRTAIAIAVLTVPVQFGATFAAVALLYTTVTWVDEVALHDGRTIEARRVGIRRFGAGSQGDIFGYEPSSHVVSVYEPDSGKLLKWKGPIGFSPVLIDFDRGTAYLVAVADRVDSDLAQFGCPEIPYIFQRYDESKGVWVQVLSKQLPAELLHANLSMRYDASLKDGKKRSKDEIEARNAVTEARSGRQLSRAIPVDFSSWRSEYKNQYRVGHHRDGCRHTVPTNEDKSHPQAAGQAADPVVLEILETKNYSPVWVIKGDQTKQFSEWVAIAWDGQLDAKCKSYLKLVPEATDRPELRGWFLFVNDPTASKKAQRSAQIVCDSDAIWFVDYERDLVTLTKFAINGDFAYRIGFQRLANINGHYGGFLQKSFRAENGYLYFEWWTTEQSGWDREIYQSAKVRIKEPGRGPTPHESK